MTSKNLTLATTNNSTKSELLKREIQSFFMKKKTPQTEFDTKRFECFSEKKATKLLQE